MEFVHAAPEDAGLSDQHILDFLDELDNKHVPMHSVLLFFRGAVIAEGYYHPYTKDSLHRMFSISKSFTAAAVGILLGDGRIALSDPIAGYFPDKVPADVHPWIAGMTIEDLLMMRTCHASTTYKNGGTDWVGSFFTTPPTHKPGTVFHYDTSAAHVLAALVERLSGMPMLDFLKKRLAVLAFSPESYMLTDPEGVSMGGTGLVATTTDLLKFGYLLLQNGNINGVQLIPSGFLTRALSCLTETAVTAPLPSEACGYGYMIWQNERGGYVCYGMGGQLIAVFPEKELILVTTADTQGIGGGNQLIYDAFYRNIYAHAGTRTIGADAGFTGHFETGGDVGFTGHFGTDGDAGFTGHFETASRTVDTEMADNTRLPGHAQTALDMRLNSLAIAPLAPFSDRSTWSLASPRMHHYHGRTYHAADPVISAVPNAPVVPAVPTSPAAPAVPIVPVASAVSVTQVVPAESVSGFTRFTFDFSHPERGIIHYTRNGQDCTLTFGLGHLETGRFPIYDLSYAASGVWMDEQTLYVRFHIIDRYVGSVHMQFYFGENDLTVFLKKVEESCFQEYNGHFYGVVEPHDLTK